MHKKISMLSFALLMTGSIDSIRNMSSIALFGSQLIFFAILGAIFFLIPIGLVSAQLVTTPGLETGGVYLWIKQAFGKHIAFFAVFLQWMNTLVWYPTILAFIAGSAAYLIHPNFAQNPWYLVCVMWCVFWGLTWINLKGVQAAAVIASVCALLGMILPLTVLLLLGAWWMCTGHPIHMHEETPHHVFRFSESWIALTAIITSFLGMELATVHAQDVYNPQKNFPRALLCSVFFIVATTIFGALIIACVLPKKHIHLVDGAMQVMSQLLNEWPAKNVILPLFGLLLVLGSLGSMINWIVSPIRGLLQAAQDGFLPPWCTYTNRYNVAQHLMLLQAVVVSIIASVFVFIPSINTSYWLLTDLSTELYVLMYVLFLLAAWVLCVRCPKTHAVFHMSGTTTVVFCILGLIGCFVTLIVGFIPPKEMIDAHAFLYWFGSGLLVMILPVCVFYWYEKK